MALQPSSCLFLPAAGITSVCYHACLKAAFSSSFAVFSAMRPSKKSAVLTSFSSTCTLGLLDLLLGDPFLQVSQGSHTSR